MKLRMRLLWWAMVRCERAAQWFRCRWLQLHEGRGAVVAVRSGACNFEQHARCSGCGCECHK